MSRGDADEIAKRVVNAAESRTAFWRSQSRWWTADCVVVLVALGVLACASAGPSPTTGLTGVVVRGPITPVCRVDVPCDAPFSAGFTVQRDGRRVGSFQSDASGQFTVFLAPGAYTVVPNADAPIILGSAQAKPVTVADTGMLTVVRLTFDTGIR